MPREHEGRDLQAKERQRFSANQQKLQGKMQQASEGTSPADTLLSDSQPPGPGDGTFWVSKPPDLWHFITAVPKNNTAPLYPTIPSPKHFSLSTSENTLPHPCQPEPAPAPALQVDEWRLLHASSKPQAVAGHPWVPPIPTITSEAPLESSHVLCRHSCIPAHRPYLTWTATSPLISPTPQPIFCFAVKMTSTSTKLSLPADNTHGFLPR